MQKVFIQPEENFERNGWREKNRPSGTGKREGGNFSWR